MSMLKKLKGLFIKEDLAQTDHTDQNLHSTPPDTNQPPMTIKWDLSVDLDDKAALLQQQNPPPANNQNTAAPPANPPSGMVTDQHVEMVLEALERHNLPGFDYLEFRHLVKLSEAAGDVDEAGRYRSALVMAKSMGRTPAQLIDDAKHYVKILEQQDQQFEQTIVLRISQEVGAMEQKIQELQANIADKQAQIQALQNAITQQEQVIQALQLQISQTITDIDTQKSNFTASSEAVQLQILEDMQKIQQYGTI